jgi:ubiquinone/menaquinone biosynthesis C-methylase UbiE
MDYSLSCCGVSCCRAGKRELDARISQDRIGDIYDTIAPLYDIWGRLTESRARSRAIELAEIKNGQNILEVAVGTGLAFYEIVKRNPNGTNIGIDLSEGMLDRARKRLRSISAGNYALTAGTAFRLNVKDASVDTLVNNYMFDLIPFEEMDAVLAEFRRVLKKSGKLVLVNMTKGERFGSNLYDLIYRAFPKAMGGCRGVRLSEKLKQLGFTVEVREYHQQLLFPSEVIAARS